jgi:hypothetical protein
MTIFQGLDLTCCPRSESPESAHTRHKAIGHIDEACRRSDVALPESSLLDVNAIQAPRHMADPTPHGHSMADQRYEGISRRVITFTICNPKYHGTSSAQSPAPHGFFERMRNRILLDVASRGPERH